EGPRRPPRNGALGNGTAGATNVLADSEIEIIALEPQAWRARGMPELSKARILVDIHLAPHPPEQWLEAEVSADVDQQVGAGGQVEEVGVTHAVGLPALVIHQDSR